jgi:rhamnosyltransferase
VSDEVEVLVVDSGSTDGTPELARSLGARVHEIPPHEFNHGGTRNTLAELAHGEILVYTVDDALPLGTGWLEALTVPLRTDPRVGATYGRQIAHYDAKPPERYFLEFLYGPKARIQRAAGLEQLSLETTLFSKVSSAIRRSVWEKFRVPSDIIMSEDQDWSARVLLAGNAIAYVPESVVKHSHPYTIGAAFKRFFDSGVSAERAYLAGGRPSAGVLRRAAARYARGELAWLWRTGQRRWIPYTVLYELAKFTGLQLGARYRYIPPWLRKRWSRLPIYWSEAAARARAQQADTARAEADRGSDDESALA